MSSQATTSVSDLIRVFAAAVEFAASDDFPPLSIVRIEAGGGTLAATASNRYVAAHARADATGELPATFALAEHAKMLLAALPGYRDYDRITGRPTLVEVAVVDGELRVTLNGTTITVPTVAHVDWPAAIDAAFTDGPTRDSSTLEGPVVVDLKWLHRIHALGNGVLGPAVLSFGGPRGMIRVEVEDWFVAMVMPMRSLPTSKPVPFGIPTKVTS